ncbi:MAG: isoprenylcysteine carboxylmethyltransferase family protein [Candidatus Acidiferrales bacterium]|jgi:protein-S-isoprenylcysteine O-methyltransferase Ste14
MTGRFDWSLAIEAPWLIFIAYWFLASLRVNKMERREPSGEQLVRIVAMLAAFFLLYDNDPRLGVLNRRFIPWRPWVFVVGAALAWAGVAFAIWARYHIGRYWSGSVALRAGHELIRTGPYARIRHPIYTGMLLAIAGTALAIGRYRALVAFAIILLGFTWKSKREEALLASQFGAAFEEHRRRTGFFLPRFS